MMAPAVVSGRDIAARITKGQVHLWMAGLDLDPRRLQALLSTLSENEWVRADRFRFERDRLRFIASRGILRTILASYQEQKPDKLRFRYGAYGKPYLCRGSGSADLRFNLSHSGGLALYAIALGREVGVDLERVRPWSVARGVAARFFSARENEALGSAPEPERAELFFQYWTAKEAYLKATGQGLGEGLEGLVAKSGRGRVELLHATESDNKGEHPYVVRIFEPMLGYVGALAVTGRDPELLTFKYEYPVGA